MDHCFMRDDICTNYVLAYYIYSIFFSGLVVENTVILNIRGLSETL